MSRTKGPKLLVELLEDRTLMSASGWLYAADVGPIGAVKNTPITIPVLTNDMSMHGGMLSVVNTTQGMNGSAVLNADNTAIIYTPNLDAIGTDLFSIWVTDGTDTASANVSINIAPDSGYITPSSSDLYSAYLAKVAQADQVYSGAVQSAVVSAQSTVASSQASLQAAADQFYATYVSESTSAQQGYNAADAALLDRYAIDVNQADALAAARLDLADSTFQSNVITAQTNFTSAWQASLAQLAQSQQLADADYTAAIALYQAAWDQAIANQGDPASFMYAGMALMNGMSQAANAKSAAYMNAGMVQQAADAAAVQTYYSAVNLAYSTTQTEFDGAQQGYTSAELSAWNLAQTAEAAAQQVYNKLGSSAWAVYQAGRVSLNAQVDASNAAIASQLGTAVSAALSTWTSSETAAWHTFTASLPVPASAPVNPNEFFVGGPFPRWDRMDQPPAPRPTGPPPGSQSAYDPPSGPSMPYVRRIEYPSIGAPGGRWWEADAWLKEQARLQHVRDMEVEYNRLRSARLPAPQGPLNLRMPTLIPRGGR